MSNSLDPDQAQHFVRLDLGPNCLQRSSAGDEICPNESPAEALIGINIESR